MQYNATSHTARISIDWLSRNYIQILPWPTYSPDINLIKTIWGVLKRKLAKEPMSNLQQLELLYSVFGTNSSKHIIIILLIQSLIV